MSSLNLVARLRASPWTSIFVRLLSVAAALAVLAWIGRSATANADAKAIPSPSSSLLLPSAPTPPPPPPPPVTPTTTTTPTPTTTSATRGRASPEDPVVLNQADEAELRRLPGIGAKRAEAIVQLRRRVGRFQRVEDLMRVKGIGRAAIKKWRPLVRLDPLPLSDGGAP